MPAGDAGSGPRMQVSAADLSAGMFVAELDRPWLDTPFVLPGFLIDRPEELEALARVCAWVWVDPERSLPELVARMQSVDRRSAVRARTPDEEQAYRTVAGVERRRSRASARDDVARQRLRQWLKQSRARHGGATVTSAGFGRWFDALLKAWRPREDTQDGAGGIRVIAPAPVDSTRFLQQMLEALSELHDVWRQAEAAAESSARIAVLVAHADGLIDGLAHARATWLADTVRLCTHDERQPGSARHAMMMAVHLVVFGQSMRMARSVIRDLACVGLFADIGMIGTAAALVDKPGMLDGEELASVQSHVARGIGGLSGALSEQALRGIAEHHERLDGSGYPAGLKGARIGRLGRMAAIVDTWLAQTRPRRHAPAIAPDEAMLGLVQWSGLFFDGELVQAFLDAVGLYPVGSRVELADGRVAMVMDTQRDRRRQPRAAGKAGFGLELVMLTDSDGAALSESDRNAHGMGEDRLAVLRGLAADESGFSWPEARPARG